VIKTLTKDDLLIHHKKLQPFKNFLFKRDMIAMTYQNNELWVQNITKPLEIKRIFLEKRIVTF
jgi:hypothetical protein